MEQSQTAAAVRIRSRPRLSFALSFAFSFALSFALSFAFSFALSFAFCLRRRRLH